LFGFLEKSVLGESWRSLNTESAHDKHGFQPASGNKKAGIAAGFELLLRKSDQVLSFGVST